MVYSLLISCLIVNIQRYRFESASLLRKGVEELIVLSVCDRY